MSPVTIDVEALARRFFQLVKAGDADGIAAAFASDGVLTLHTGHQFIGRDAVSGFYRGLFERGGPSPTVLRAVTQGLTCAIELDPGGQQVVAADFLTFNATGEIVALTIYTRRPPETAA